MKRLLVLLLMAAAFSGWPDVVHVTQQSVASGRTNVLSSVTKATGAAYETLCAPEISGHMFVGWTIEPASPDDLTAVDEYGRALDVATYRLYNDLVLTANYLPASEDRDGDGLPDGWELYWFGSLQSAPNDDVDQDGKDNSFECSAGTNPLFADNYSPGGILSLGVGDTIQYNPMNLQYYVIRSEPEGRLFATISNLVTAGTWVDTAAYDFSSSSFAYWTVAGVRQADEYGRALESVSFCVPTKAIEVVAVCEQNETTRKLLYWFGHTDVDLGSDEDGDGVSLATELLIGTNPYFAETFSAGGIQSIGTGGVLQYNPQNLQYYVIRSNPEGELFSTISNLVAAGTTVTTPAVGETFAYWTQDGVRLADEYGRAVENVTFTVPTNATELVAVCETDETIRKLLYWFGRTDIDLSSDADGDGVPLSREFEVGTNPLFADVYNLGGVSGWTSDVFELNLQPYEQIAKLTIGGVLQTVMTGTNLKPVVCDINEDGLFDVVLVSDTGVRILMNVGSDGSPEFEERSGVALTGVDLDMNSTSKLSENQFDVAASQALSATWCDIDADGFRDMLVSDVYGRIAYYHNESGILMLQHRVWGGTCYGFATGLQIAAVDWENDGDVDCLCGTADGRLLLLKNPEVGHPSGVRAVAGVDSILLDWDPHAQSCVRGYNVYRDVDQSGNFVRITPELVTLPSYRDRPEGLASYDYRITSVSRFYSAGNSTPTVCESTPTDVVRAELGKVSLRWSDAAGFVGEEIVVSLGIENSLNLSGGGLTLVVGFDSTAMTPVRVEMDGLLGNATLNDEVGNGAWTISSSGGEVAAGGGTLLRLVFRGIRADEQTLVSLRSASMKSIGDSVVSVVMPTVDAKIAIVACEDPGQNDLTVVVPYSLGDLNGDGRLTKDDRQLLARLMNGGKNVKWTANELRAGDYNGNGKLDQDDYQLLKADFKQKGVK